MRLVIKGGRLFDPVHGWLGQEGDLYLAEGRIVPHLDQADRVIVATGLAVTPAGIDLRAGVAAYGRQYCRLWGWLPPAAEIARTYLRLGYTYLHEPGATLETAAYVHRELAALPGVDTSISLTFNLRDVDLWLKTREHLPEVAAACRYFLSLTRALNLRVAEPFVHYQQEFYRHRCLALPDTLPRLAEIAGHLGQRLTLEAKPELLLQAPAAAAAFHLGGLGLAVNSERHLAGAQRWLEEGASGDLGLPPENLRPEPPPWCLDLGRSEPVTWPRPGTPENHHLTRKLAWAPADLAVAFSGADVLLTPPATYPELWAALLTGPGAQTGADEAAARAWTFSELIRRTRWLPAQYLGLKDRGHLQPGARAEVALYDLPRQESPAAWQQCLSHCRYLIKGGEIVIDNYRWRNQLPPKATFYLADNPEPNRLARDICRHRSFQPERLAVAAFPDLQWEPVT